MAYSYKCAISQQSIPAYSVEPTEVVVVLPDPPGGVMRGFWDGYGHLLPPGVDTIQAAQNIQLYSTPEFHLPRRLTLLLGSDDPAVHEPAVRMIKAKYYQPEKHTYATVAASKPCPAHGMFYKQIGSWNEPAHRAPRPKKAADGIGPAAAPGGDLPAE